MIQIIKPEKAPKILRDANSSGPKENATLREAYDQGQRDFKFKARIYGAKSVKNLLIKVQNGKCCFCESRVTHISYGDVEHFRPKGGTRQEKADALLKPGYYWLAYDWSNLFLSCTICNQRFKKNLFPLAAPAKRAVSHHDDLSEESPLFINPATDNPQDDIAFRSEIAYPVGGSRRGKITIDLLGLNRSELQEMRLDQLEKAKLVKRTVQILTKIQQQNGQLDSELETLLQEHKQALADYSQPATEYSSMLQALLA